MNPNDESPAPGSAPRPEPIPAAVKSRAVGCLLVLLGVGAVVGALLIGEVSRKVLAALMAIAACAPLWGIGMILFPWTDEMFALNQQDNFGKMFAAMPRIWKVWFFLCIVVMLAALFATLALT